MTINKTPATTRRESSNETASRSESPLRRPPTAATRTKRTTGTRADAQVGVTEEHIRVRAYYVSLEREGCPPDPLGDWLRAERELSEGTGHTE